MGLSAKIDEKTILDFLYKRQGRWTQWDELMEAFPDGTIPNVAICKMSRLIRRGLVDGSQGRHRRGDFEITDAGLRLIDKPRIERRGYRVLI